MKRNFTRILLILLVSLSTGPFSGYSQGRVVINEYLPWPYTSCGARAEFIELFNFGPGPMDIGCWIITDGDFAIQIPAGTVIQPGAFYVLGGQTTIAYGCGNISSALTVDLNWYTCGCTSGPIPTVTPALFTDGGTSSEQVVLLDPGMKVIDAVVRKLPPETSSLLTNTGTGGCGSSYSFDLDNLTFTYEVIGESDGRGNSMAREVDGDCVWVKDTQQSGGSTNNTGNYTSSMVANMTVVEPYGCPNTGQVDITIEGTTQFLNATFPMSYILAKDLDQNGIYDLSDQYTEGTATTAPTISLTGLEPGFYRVVIASVLGCNLKQFDFQIIDCTVLAYELSEFTANKRNDQQVLLNWQTENTEVIRRFEIEKSMNGGTFLSIGEMMVDPLSRGSKEFNYTDESLPTGTSVQYRLKMVDVNGNIKYSAIRIISFDAIKILNVSAYPNPFRDQLKLSIKTPVSNRFTVRIQDAMGRVIRQWNEEVPAGESLIQVDASKLPNGILLLNVFQDDRRIYTQKLQKTSR